MHSQCNFHFFSFDSLLEMRYGLACTYVENLSRKLLTKSEKLLTWNVN